MLKSFWRNTHGGNFSSIFQPKISEIDQLTSDDLDPSEMILRIFNIAKPYMGNFSFIDYWNTDEALHTLHFYHQDSLKTQLVEDFCSRKPSKDFASHPFIRAIDTKQTVILTHLTKPIIRDLSVDIDELNLIEGLECKAMVCVPIQRKDRVIGLLFSGYSDLDQDLSSDQIQFMEQVGKRLALPIHHFAVAQRHDEIFKKAEEKCLAKNLFLANMSHEMRTPLGIILGYTDLSLENSHLPTDVRCQLGIIRKNCEQLLHIVGEVLDLSKVEADQIDFEPIQIHLPTFVRDTLLSLSLKAREKGLHLKTDFRRLPYEYVKADPGRLRQIINNLVGNAIKFTESGEVIIRISQFLGPNQLHQVYLKFEVIDHGIGISPEQAEKLFQPFSQGDSSMNRRFGGTGLGLVLSRQLARAMHGDVVLSESRPGLGSTFTLTLNCEASLFLDPPSEQFHKYPSPQTQIANQNLLEGMKILLVEDSEDNRLIIGHCLESAGTSIDFACNGLEGIQKASQGNFDLVLMDIQMPILEGYEATKRLRLMNYAKPIIALTAHALKDEKERALAAGFTDYLTKPIDRYTLLQALSHYKPIRL